MSEINYNINIRINKNEWEIFKEKSGEKGLSSSAIIRIFINKFNEDPSVLSKLI